MASGPAPTQPPTQTTESVAPEMIAVPPPWRIVVLVVAVICTVIVVRNIFGEAHQVIGWAVAASLIAMLLSPIVRGMDRRMPRALAIVVTFVAVAALGFGVTWLYSSTLLDQVAQIQESGPTVADEIEQRDDQIGQIARDIDLTARVTELTERLDERTGSGNDAIRSAALSAPPYFVSMILTIFLLLFGPQMVQGGLDQLRPERRDRLRPALAEATRRTQIYVWASVAQGVLSGIAIWVVGSWLDVPAIGLVALFGATIATVPYVGVGVGWLPVVLLGLGTASGVQVGVAVGLAAALQVVEWLRWRPFVDERSLHVGPAIPVIVAIVGFGIYGIGGAVYGCIVAVLCLAIADQVSPGNGDLPTPLDDVPTD